MWQTHSRRNRAILIALAVILLAGGGLGVLVAGGWLPAPGDRLDVPVAGLADAGTRGGAGAVAIGCVVVVVAVLLFLSVLPRRPRSQVLREEDDSGALTSIDSEVVSRAATESARHRSLVTDAQVRVGGTLGAPVLRARYTVRQDAPIRESVGLITGVLVPEIEGVLGSAFETVHIRVDVSAGREPAAGSVDLAELG